MLNPTKASMYTLEELGFKIMRQYDERNRERTCFIHPRQIVGRQYPALSLLHSLRLECHPTALFEKQVSALSRRGEVMVLKTGALLTNQRVDSLLSLPL